MITCVSLFNDILLLSVPLGHVRCRHLREDVAINIYITQRSNNSSSYKAPHTITNDHNQQQHYHHHHRQAAPPQAHQYSTTAKPHTFFEWRTRSTVVQGRTDGRTERQQEEKKWRRMRASTALKLLPACCGFLLSSTPAPADAAFAKKAIFDYRTGEDFGTEANCGELFLLPLLRV